MTDTGRIPGEGLPESAGTVRHPGLPGAAAQHPPPSATPASPDDDLLLMPGAQGAWMEDAGEPAAAARPARRAAHAGPPSGATAVRSLADRGPAGPPPEPVTTPGPATGPEYLDVPNSPNSPHSTPPGQEPAGAAPWHPHGAEQAGQVQTHTAHPHAPGPWNGSAPDGTPVVQEDQLVTEQYGTDTRAAQPEAYAGHHPVGHAEAPAPQHAGIPTQSAYDSAPRSGELASGHVPYGTPPHGTAAHGTPPHGVDPGTHVEGPTDTLGRFVPVQGQVPTTPHLSPTPPHAMRVPDFPEPEPEPAQPQDEFIAGVPADAGHHVPPAEEFTPHAPEHVAGEHHQPQAGIAEVIPAAAEAQYGPVEAAAGPDGARPVAAAEGNAMHLGLPRDGSAQEAPEQGVFPQDVPAQDVFPVDEQPAQEPVPAGQFDQGAPAPEPNVRDLPDEQTAAEQQLLVVEPVEPSEPVELAVTDGEVQPQAADAVAPAEHPAVDAPAAEVVTADGPPSEGGPAEAAPGTDRVSGAPDEDTSRQGHGASTTDGHEDGAPAPEAGPVAGDGAGIAPTRGPAAPAYGDAEREAVMRVIRERRDIRNGFRPDPIPHEVLLRVLEAAHTAPSVGHSQPWDFVVIRSERTRRSMHELAMQQREEYAKSLPKARAKQFRELKIEAILDTPVNIVVTADPTRGGRHTLGRHTQPQMAPYSSALAVENLWLAARAEGLGVGWVSFFDERETVRELGLPEHLEVVAYLCVGYVDEFPAEPELMQAGWSKRRPLSWVVHEETYGRRALPGEEPHDLLAETVSHIRPLDAKALGEAWERQKVMTKPAGALGMLEIISAQLSGLSRMCPPPVPEPAAVAIFAGDHGVHAQGVTPWPQEVTGQMVANFLSGGAVCNAFAHQVGAEVCVIDVGVASELPATPGLLPRKVRPGTADMTEGPALSREDVLAAIEVGIETARDLVAAGNKALLTGEMGIANTTASAALISVFTETDPAEVTGRGTGIDDETLVRKAEVVRRALELHRPDPSDPVGVLAAVGGLEHAALVGFLLGGASLRTPVILDGVSTGAAALVARAIAPEVLAACIAGHRSAEPGHVAALNKLGLRPLVDLDLRLGEGTGALLALPVVQSAARAVHEVATFDSAGVTEK